jgi:hypothetical protein
MHFLFNQIDRISTFIESHLSLKGIRILKALDNSMGSSYQYVKGNNLFVIEVVLVNVSLDLHAL